jgi:hypothetical protein
MKTPHRSSLTLAALVLATPLSALAHPGHGDPDFTWEFSHLAANPIATLGCVLVLAGGFWALAAAFHRIRKTRRARRQ